VKTHGRGLEPVAIFQPDGYNSALAEPPLRRHGVKGLSGMPGEQFSRLYLRPTDLAQDSGRARHRIAALFRERVFSDHAERLVISAEKSASRYPATADIRHIGINSSVSAVLPIF
jgi:hypothetical protein